MAGDCTVLMMGTKALDKRFTPLFLVCRRSRKLVLPLLTIPLFLVLTSCDRDLSREKAAGLIETSAELNEYKTNLLLQDKAIQHGVDLGWWQVRGGAVENFTPRLSTEGSEVKRAMFGFGSAYLVLKAPVALAVMVTGIAGDRSFRAAEFTWHYKDLPPLSRRIAVQGGVGRAAFRLYDDGWRLVELVSMTPSKSPYPLTDQDKQDIAKDLALERERRISAEKEAAEAKRALDERVRLARTATRVISRHALEGIHGTWGAMAVDLTVTNVSVQVHQRVKEVRNQDSSFEIFFSQVWRENAIAAVAQGSYLSVHDTLIITSDLERGSSEVANAINQAFADWKTQHARLVRECANTPTWGCVAGR